MDMYACVCTRVRVGMRAHDVCVHAHVCCVCSSPGHAQAPLVSLNPHNPLPGCLGRVSERQPRPAIVPLHLFCV